MTPYVERENGRTVAVWDECGMRFRSNVVEPGGRIPLHAHSYDHVAAVFGQFRLRTDAPDGTQTVEVIERGKRTIPAGWKHEFEFLGTQGVGEVLCFCPIGHDGVS